VRPKRSSWKSPRQTRWLRQTRRSGCHSKWHWWGPPSKWDDHSTMLLASIRAPRVSHNAAKPRAKGPGLSHVEFRTDDAPQWNFSEVRNWKMSSVMVVSRLLVLPPGPGTQAAGGEAAEQPNPVPRSTC